MGSKAKFKVGDRVRVTNPMLLRYGTPIGAMGTITMAGNNYVEFDLDHPEDGKIEQVLSYPHDYLELVAVAQQPQPLRIEAGKFYRTRDGRKVGPMEMVDGHWSPNRGMHWYNDDGSRVFGNNNGTVIISEWVDEPTDTAGYTVPLCAYEDEAYKEVSASGKFTVAAATLSVSDGSSWIQIAGNQPAIVCLIENGQIRRFDLGSGRGLVGIAIRDAGC